MTKRRTSEFVREEIRRYTKLTPPTIGGVSSYDPVHYNLAYDLDLADNEIERLHLKLMDERRFLLWMMDHLTDRRGWLVDAAHDEETGNDTP